MYMASQVALQVKNLPAMQGTQKTRVWSLGWEDTLEEGMVIYSSILAWRIPWTEEPGGLQSIGITKSQTPTEAIDHAHTPYGHRVWSLVGYSIFILYKLHVNSESCIT